MKAMKSIAAGSKDTVMYPVTEMRDLLVVEESTKPHLFYETCEMMRYDTLARV